MSIAEECLKHAEDCEREAAACSPGSSRDTLLSTAAQWRRMAEAAAHEETAWRLIAGKPVIQEHQAQQQQQTQTPDETMPKT
jgi:hypothetical protein